MESIPESPIESFLSLYSVTTTQRRYRSALRELIDYLYGRQRAGRRATPDEAERYEPLARQYLTTHPSLTEDLIRFAASLTVPKSATTTLAAVLEFCDHYGLDISPRDRKRIRSKLPKGGAISIDAEVDPEILRTFFSHMALNCRTLALVLVSSGMRIGEALQLQIRDVNLSATPAEIIIRAEYTKGRQQRVTFISAEAAEAVREWLKVRDQYLASSMNRGLGLHDPPTAKSPTDPRLFPWDKATTTRMWTNALRKANLFDVDPATHRMTIHPHLLRKVFRSQLALTCPVDIVETLMGHQGYLTDAYRRYTTRQMAEYYLQAEEHVTIMIPASFRDLKGELTQKMGVQNEIVNGLTAKTLRLENRIDQLESSAREQNRVIETLIDVARVREYE